MLECLSNNNLVVLFFFRISGCPSIMCVIFQSAPLSSIIGLLLIFIHINDVSKCTSKNVVHLAFGSFVYMLGHSFASHIRITITDLLKSDG